MKRFELVMATLAVPILVAIARSNNNQSTNVLTPVLGNYPNTSLPLSANTTVTPDAQPTNTTRITISTSTNFKGALEASPVTGVVRITNARPAGTYTITVHAFDSGGASATKMFTLAVSTPLTCNPISVAPLTSFTAGWSPRSVVVGDFNRDGNQDLAVVNENSDDVSIFLGNGAGHFSETATLTVGSLPVSIAVGDFNGDGKQDLAVANAGPNTVSVFLGDGVGGFTTPINVGVGGYLPYSIEIGDFNGDGRQDLAFANANSNNVSILLGSGDGNFNWTGTNYTVGSAPVSVAVGDFNRDGNQDLVLANQDSNSVSILLGDGAGHFSAFANYAVGDHPESVTVGDFNVDGNQDLAVANTNSNNISILLGDGTGHFSAATNYAVSNEPTSVVTADFDGDGKQDLAVADHGSNNVSMLLGDVAGHFRGPINFFAGAGTISVTVGDFNSDGKQDLAIANYANAFDDGGLSVMLRDCALTPTSVVSRKTHGGAGNFDLNLPLTGTLGIECRTTGGTNDYTLLVNFPSNVFIEGFPQAQVTVGSGTIGTNGVGNGGFVTVNGNVVTIPLTNISNAQIINVTLFGINGGDNLVISMGVLVGDENGNRTVNAADVAQTKARLGQTVDATNFRSDVNANGSINAADTAIVKQNSGTSLPP